MVVVFFTARCIICSNVSDFRFQTVFDKKNTYPSCVRPSVRYNCAPTNSTDEIYNLASRRACDADDDVKNSPITRICKIRKKQLLLYSMSTAAHTRAYSCVRNRLFGSFRLDEACQQQRNILFLLCCRRKSVYGSRD